MKKYKRLSDRILTIDNFMEAYNNAIKGKSHYKEVIEIKKNPLEYVSNLLEDVKNKTYKVSEYKVFQLYTGRKWREIYKLPMRDRIVQHAIMNVCEPIFRESFILDTYSSIKTRGIHLGLSRVKKALKDKDYKYCLKLDIKKCYPSLDKEILKKKLFRKFRDNHLQWLFEVIIDSCEQGVPIGNYTSQYFANFYFNDFDHWLKECKHVKYYFRYCDDMIIFGHSKEELHKLLAEIREKIDTLHVKLKDNHQIFPIDDRGIDFLGYISRRTHLAVRKHIKYRFIRKVKGMDFESLSDRDLNVLSSYWGILVHCSAKHLWRKYTCTKNYNELYQAARPKFPMKDFLYKNLVVIDSRVTSSKLYFIVEMDTKYITIYTTSKTLRKSIRGLKCPAVVFVGKNTFSQYILIIK